MRPLRAEIHLDALRHNVELARHHSGDAQCMAVVKAQAYGHQIDPVARAIAHLVDGFAVASLTEALCLRQCGMDRPILLLEGVFTPEEYQHAQQADCWWVVHSHHQIDWLEACLKTSPNLYAQKTPSVWIKVNSGMNRLGFSVGEVQETLGRIKGLIGQVDLVLMTHLACADERDNPFTEQQLGLFNQVCQLGTVFKTSVCNSAALLREEIPKGDWVRPGLMLYGVQPWAEATHDLKPVMCLMSEIIAVRWLEAGSSVGYGQQWRAQQPTRMGVVACGYADGYPRHIDGARVYIEGGYYPVIGRVSMDMLCVDLTTAPPSCGVGCSVELFGAHLNVAEVARCANTLAYEVLCNIHARVPRVILGESSS
jgi:alanine racemase